MTCEYTEISFGEVAKFIDVAAFLSIMRRVWRHTDSSSSPSHANINRTYFKQCTVGYFLGPSVGLIHAVECVPQSIWQSKRGYFTRPAGI